MPREDNQAQQLEGGDEVARRIYLESDQPAWQRDRVGGEEVERDTATAVGGALRRVSQGRYPGIARSLTWSICSRSRNISA